MNNKCRLCDGTGWVLHDGRKLGTGVTVEPCSCYARFGRSVTSFKRATAFLGSDVPEMPRLPVRRVRA